jgi:hypothetical protein
MGGLIITWTILIGSSLMIKKKTALPKMRRAQVTRY